MINHQTSTLLIDSRDRRDSSPKQVFKTEKTPSAQSLEVSRTDSGRVQWPIKQFRFFVIKKRSTSLFSNGESDVPEILYCFQKE